MSFQRKTTLAIVLIALFVIGNQVFIGCWLIQKKYDAKVINVSGKQRMLSQRIMALTFDYQIHKNRAEVTEAQALFEEWKIAHYSLMNGDKAGEIKGTSLVIKQSLKQLTAQIIFAESIIKKIDDLRPNELLKFNESQTQFLVKMDKIVTMIETESNQKIYTMIVFQFLFSIIIIGIIIFEIKFVFEPIMNHLKKQNKELQNSNRTLNEYASIASHDLRSPIQNILRFLTLLKKSIPEKLNRNENIYLEYIEESALRMNQTTIDLLRYSTSNNVQKKRVNTAFLLQNVLADLQAKISDSQAIVTIKNLPEIINIDENLFRLLFQNLISNAIKFMPKNSIPQINISSKIKKDDFIFCVSDNGIGIKKEYHEKIFKIFNRLHTRNDYEGTGIGLSLCKRIVEGHEGIIWIESEIEQGSRFYFSIPKE